MKNNTKTIAVVLAVFLVAALFVGAGAARDVANGETAFVYENNVTLDAGIAVPADNRLIRYDGNGGVAEYVTVKDVNGAKVLDLTVQRPTAGKYTIGPDGNADGIWIEYPEIVLDAKLGEDGTDSIDKSTVTKQTPFRFEITAPKLGTAFNNSTTEAPLGEVPVLKIVITTPAGGQTTAIQYDPSGNAIYDYTNFGINDTRFNVHPLTPQVGSGVYKPYANVTVGENTPAGTYSARAEFIMNESNGIKGFKDYAPKSNIVTYTVQSSTLTLTANADSVIRSNPFTVTIQGVANDIYFLYLEAGETGPVPKLQADQVGMKLKTYDPSTGLNYSYIPSGVTNVHQADESWSYFSVDAGGKRNVQFNTYTNTTDRTYTINVVSLKKIDGVYDNKTNPDNQSVKGTESDKVKVKVEVGAMSITASGDHSYFIGDEIKLTGTNTDSSGVWLFIVGPNLMTDGVQLIPLSTQKPAGEERPADVSVKTDNTWEYKWDTSNVGLDVGAYTIYATSKLTNGKSNVVSGKADKLTNSEYATVSVNLKRPYLSAVPSGAVVAKGDKLYIRGSAEGNPSSLTLYIFGPNKFVTETISVEDDGTYEKELLIGTEWSSNQYFVVIEHPMYNSIIDVYVTNVRTGETFSGDATGVADQLLIWIPQDTQAIDPATVQSSFTVWGNGKLQGSNAADALTKNIDSANIDDIYTKLSFTVTEPWIKINNPGDKAVGSTFTITGTTNLAVDDQIMVSVASSSFTAIDKTAASETSGVTQSTKVVKGDGVDNVWSIDVDTTNWKLDEYTIKAEGLEVSVTTTTNFNLVEKVVVTPTQTGATPTTTQTSAPVTTAAPETPGFGAFIALAGLGAVALLVLRRD